MDQPCSIDALDGLSASMFEAPHRRIVALEVLWLIASLLLLASEIIQMIFLKRLYFSELENYIELYILISAFVAMGCKEEMLKSSTTAAITRGLVSLGISFGGIKVYQYSYVKIQHFKVLN